MTAPIDAFLLATPRPSSSEVASYLSTFSGESRYVEAQALIGRGVPSMTVSSALAYLNSRAKAQTFWIENKATILGALAVASAAASAYHGTRRNKSIWWGAVWFGLGLTFPVFTPVVALAQGYGKPRG